MYVTLKFMYNYMRYDITRKILVNLLKYAKNINKISQICVTSMIIL